MLPYIEAETFPPHLPTTSISPTRFLAGFTVIFTSCPRRLRYAISARPRIGLRGCATAPRPSVGLMVRSVALATSLEASQVGYSRLVHLNCPCRVNPTSVGRPILRDARLRFASAGSSG